MEMNKKRNSIIYQQKFRFAWTKDPDLQGWLRENKTKPNKAYCAYCKCDLVCKFSDLKNHSLTKKHIKASIAEQQETLSDSLIMVKNAADDIEGTIIQVQKRKHEDLMKNTKCITKKVKVIKPQKFEDYIEELPITFEEPLPVDDNDEEFLEVLNEANDIETLEIPATTTTLTKLQEEKLKAEIDFYQQKTQYFAKLTENSKIQKSLMVLQARKLNLEIKKMQES